MELKGKIIIFPERKTGKNGEFNVFKGRLATKNKEGKYVEKLVDLSFDKERFPEAKLNNLNPEMSYTLEVEQAFLIVDQYKEATFFRIYVKEAHLTGEPRPVHKAQDLPF